MVAQRTPIDQFGCLMAGTAASGLLIEPARATYLGKVLLGSASHFMELHAAMQIQAGRALTSQAQ